MAYTDDQMGPRRRALVDSLAGNTGISGAMPGGMGLPQMGAAPAPGNLRAVAQYQTTPEQNAEIARRQNALIGQQNTAFAHDNAFLQAHGGQRPDGWRSEESQLPSAVNPLDVLGAGAKNLAAPQGAPAAAGAKPTGPFQSGNASVSGYLQDAVRDFAPTMRGIKDEAGRKSALNQYLTTLEPEVEKRGGHLSDIHGDGANVDGRRIDFFRDIEGAADPQYLDVTDGGGAKAPMGRGMNPMFAGSSIAPMLQGDPSAGIQNALQQIGGLSNTSRLQQLIAQLSGGGQ